MNQKQFTPKQLEIQARCFQLLRRKVDAYYDAQDKMPDFIKDEDPDEMIGTIARWILEENSAEAFGEEEI
jgi:hypothetical protein